MNYALTLKSMSEEFKELEEFRILEWHGELGAKFAVDDLIVEVETHKVVLELYATVETFLRRIDVAEGAWAKPSDLLGVLSTEESGDIEDDKLTPLPLNVTES